MVGNISVKKELQALQYDIDKGLEAGNDAYSLLAIARTKIANIMKMDAAHYCKVVWSE